MIEILKFYKQIVIHLSLFKPFTDMPRILEIMYSLLFWGHLIFAIYCFEQYLLTK